MARLIQDTIRRALADELLFGRLVDGGRLTVDVDADGKPVLDIQPAREERQAEGRAGDRPNGALRDGSTTGASRAPVLFGCAAPGPGGRSSASSRRARGCSRCELVGRDEERFGARPRRTPRAPRRRTGSSKVSSPASTRRAKRSYSSASACSQSAALGSPGRRSRMPAATPPRMSMTWANSWMTTL